MKNDANFEALDKLIGEGGVDLQTFLENNPAPEVPEEVKEEDEKVEEEPVVREKEKLSEREVRRDADSVEVKVEEKETEVKCEEQISKEEKEKTNKEEANQEEQVDENKRILIGEDLSEQKSPKVIKTYSRRGKGEF